MGAFLGGLFCGETFFGKKVSPHPFQKTSLKEVFGISILGELVLSLFVLRIGVVSLCTDGRREPQVRSALASG